MDEWVRRALGAAERASRGQAVFGTWELRAAAALVRGRHRIALDGGCRIERAGDTPGVPAPSAFSVGSPPEDLSVLAGAATGSRGDDWTDAAGAAGAAAERRLADLADAAPAVFEQMVARGLLPSAVRHEVHLRVRSWWRRGGEPRAELAASVRLRGRWAGGGTRGGFDFCAADLRGLAAAAAAFVPDGAPPVAGRSEAAPATADGPLVLAPPAAAWWAHEMAHAVLEGAAAPRQPGGVLVRDDPRRAPWPFGYEWDDAGFPAADLGVEGHLRRASVREPARPLPSVTWVEGPAGPASPPGGTLLARHADGARFDPASRTIVLELRDLLRTDGRVQRPVARRAVAIVRLADVRATLVGASTKPARPFEPASCARQGSLFAVMVGAPTLMLDPVRVNL